MVTHGTLPNLANSLLIVTNPKGSLLMGIKPLSANRYSFQVVGVTTSYRSVSGSGFLTVFPSPTTADLVIAFHSARK
jgi:hypothetical protein